MALTNPVLATQGGDSANNSTYDTAALVLTAGRIYYISVGAYRSGGANDPVSIEHDPTGTPLAFAVVSDGTTSASINGAGGGGQYGLYVWAVRVTSTTGSAVIRITFSGARSACGWIVWYTTGEQATNTHRQVVLAATSNAVTMAAFGATDNMAVLVTSSDDQAATFTPTEGRSEIAEQSDAERMAHADDYQNPHGGDTTLNMTVSVGNPASIGIEIVAAAAVTRKAGRLTLLGAGHGS